MTPLGERQLLCHRFPRRRKPSLCWGRCQVLAVQELNWGFSSGVKPLPAEECWLRAGAARALAMEPQPARPARGVFVG